MQDAALTLLDLHLHSHLDLLRAPQAHAGVVFAAPAGGIVTLIFDESYITGNYASGEQVRLRQPAAASSHPFLGPDSHFNPHLAAVSAGAVHGQVLRMRSAHLGTSRQHSRLWQTPTRFARDHRAPSLPTRDMGTAAWFTRSLQREAA